MMRITVSVKVEHDGRTSECSECIPSTDKPSAAIGLAAAISMQSAVKSLGGCGNSSICHLWEPFLRSMACCQANDEWIFLLADRAAAWSTAIKEEGEDDVTPDFAQWMLDAINSEKCPLPDDDPDKVGING